MEERWGGQARTMQPCPCPCPVTPTAPRPIAWATATHCSASSPLQCHTIHTAAHPVHRFQERCNPPPLALARPCLSTATSVGMWDDTFVSRMHWDQRGWAMPVKSCFCSGQPCALRLHATSLCSDVHGAHNPQGLLACGSCVRTAFSKHGICVLPSFSLALVGFAQGGSRVGPGV